LTTRRAADLIDFATTQKKQPGPECSTCALPERAAIDEAKRKAGYRKLGGRTVRRWLIAKCGYTEETAPHEKAIGAHFNNGHHQEAA
jgi:hypothetical protein